jgi:predicted NBD/HSP70 family sugar kinase
MKTYWGIDLGGTKIEIVVMEKLDPDAVLIRERIPTGSDKGYEHILNQIAKAIDIAAEKVGHRPELIGMGTPGAHDPQTGTMKNSNSTALNGMPMKRDLENKLGIPVKMANDANCFALAEATMGIVPDIMPDAEVVFGVIMGTGVGGGLVVNGKVINGRQGIAGEWGHSYLDPSGGTCYCGQVGCVERILAGPSLQRYYHSISGEELKLKEIVGRKDSDPHAKATMDRLIHFFGRGIANLVDILDPDAIVIGGGVGNINELYTDGVKAVEQFVFNPRLDTQILKPKLGDSAGVFGAAALTV